jgi:hypothetical protein
MIRSARNTLLFVLVAAVLIGAPTQPASAHHSLSAHNWRFAVILVLDGARPDYFNIVPMPNVRWVEQRGAVFNNSFVGQLIANTPPSHATIGTGLFPKHTGIEGFWWKDPNTGRMTRPTELDQVRAHAMENIEAAHHVSSIASSVKRQDPSARVIAASGHKCYAADAMGTPAADYILCANIYHDRWVAQAIPGHLPPPGALNNPHWDVPIPAPASGFAPAVQQWNLGAENDWTVKYSLWTFNRVHYPRVMMLNLPETDVTGHFLSGIGPVQKSLMRHFNTELGWIIAAYRKAGILNRTDFVITADHGMAFIKDRLPFSNLDRAMELAGSGKVYLEADTAASIGVVHTNRARAVAANIARLDGPEIDATFYKVDSHGNWSYKAAYDNPALTRPMRAAYQLLANTDASPSGGDVLGVYAPRVTTGDRPIGKYHWDGGHLGPQWDDQHIPLIIGGAGVKPGIYTNYPARLVDIAPTVERLLGSPIERTDGVVLDSVLKAHSNSLAAKQKAAGKLLMPVTAALRERLIDAG